MGKKTVISPPSLRILCKYWRDVGGSDFTRVPGAVNQEKFLLHEMGKWYPYGLGVNNQWEFIALLKEMLQRHVIYQQLWHEVTKMEEQLQHKEGSNTEASNLGLKKRKESKNEEE